MDLLGTLEYWWNYPVIPGALKGCEAVATLTGAIGVYLATRNRVANFPWNVVSSLLFAGVFWQSELRSSALLQLFGFVPLLGLGWWLWSRGTEGDALPITRVNRNGWFVVGVFIAVFTLGWGLLMQRIGGAAQPFVDAAVTGASVAGQYLQSRRLLENWYIWIGVNLVYCVYLLPLQGLWFSTGLYTVFLALAVFGFIQWRREMTKQHSPYS